MSCRQWLARRCSAARGARPQSANSCQQLARFGETHRTGVWLPKVHELLLLWLCLMFHVCFMFICRTVALHVLPAAAFPVTARPRTIDASLLCSQCIKVFTGNRVSDGRSRTLRLRLPRNLVPSSQQSWRRGGFGRRQSFFSGVIVGKSIPLRAKAKPGAVCELGFTDMVGPPQSGWFCSIVSFELQVQRVSLVGNAMCLGVLF